MKEKDFSKYSDEEILIEKKKLKNSKITHAFIIGFLAAIVIFGLVSWSLSEENRLGFFIPMLFPIYIIYRLLKNPKQNKELESVLKERKLNQ